MSAVVLDARDLDIEELDALGLGKLLVGLQHQALDPLAALEVLLDDFLDVVLVLVGVPDRVGIDHHGRTQLAALHATGLGDGDVAEPRRLDAPGDHFHEVAPAAVGATAARMALGPLVAAAEDVGFVIKFRFLELGSHDCVLS
jgi:hypothetical protein